MFMFGINICIDVIAWNGAIHSDGCCNKAGSCARRSELIQQDRQSFKRQQLAEAVLFTVSVSSVLSSNKLQHFIMCGLATCNRTSVN